MPDMRSTGRLVPLVVLGLLAACGGSDDTDGATTDIDDPATTAVVTQPATTAPVSTTNPPTTVATTTPATTAAPEPAAWEPIGRGEYDVGVETIMLDDPAGVRPLTVDVWFPIDAGVDAAALPPQQYTLLPGVYYESPAALAATAPEAAAGPFPLIVYSHGSGGLRYIHSGYTEVLASHGYVVAAPDHTGNTAVDRLAGTDADPAQNAFNRPNDVRRVIDALTDPAHPTAGGYASRVDGDHVAVTGHSFGGFTSIAMATGFSNEVGELTPDDRVDAIVPLAPAVGDTLLTDERLASVGVPTMVLVGTDDITTPVDPNVTRLWDLSTSTPGYRVELVAAEHQSFTDICAYQENLPALADVPQIVTDTIDEFAVQGCSPGDMDDARANDITTTYVLAFLDEVFAGGPPIDPTLVAPPDDVVFTAR